MAERQSERHSTAQPVRTFWDVVVVGGGASGLMAAIGAGQTARQNGHTCSVLVLDAGVRSAGKIYVTGNGRCNLTNLVQNSGCYYTDSGADPYRCLSGRGAAWLMDFFRQQGVLLHSRNGYVYPQSDQAETIAGALLAANRRLGTTIVQETRVQQVTFAQDHFQVETSPGRSYAARCVILCAGGMVNRKFGCIGDGAAIAAGFGHTLVPPLPALCALRSSAPGLRMMSGVRAEGEVGLWSDGALLGTQAGSLQLTSDGISGIPVFNLSHLAGRALEKGRPVLARLNLVPGRSAEELQAAAWQHLSLMQPDDLLRDVFLGMTHSKAAAWLLQQHGLVAEMKVRRLGTAQEAAQKLLPVFENLQKIELPIVGTRGFDEAQTTAGGVVLEEVNPDTMESERRHGLFLAGEVLDVDGICGGYNLTFAMCTGYTAGESAAKEL